MLYFIKDSFSLYKQYFSFVLLIGVTIVLPFQIIYTLVMNYIALPFSVFGLPLWTGIFQSFFMLIVVFLIMIPFISVIIQHLKFEKAKLSSCYKDILKHGFFVYLVAILIALLVTIGFYLFIIPGVIALIFTISIPVIKVIDDLSFKETILKSFKFGKDQFLSILGLLVIFAIADYIASFILSMGAIMLTGHVAAVNWALMLLNMFVLPIFIFALTKMYTNWNGDEEEVYEEGLLDSLKQYQ